MCAGSAFLLRLEIAETPPNGGKEERRFIDLRFHCLKNFPQFEDALWFLNRTSASAFSLASLFWGGSSEEDEDEEIEQRVKHASSAPLGDLGFCFSFSTSRHLRSGKRKYNCKNVGRNWVSWCTRNVIGNRGRKENRGNRGNRGSKENRGNRRNRGARCYRELKQNSWAKRWFFCVLTYDLCRVNLLQWHYSNLWSCTCVGRFGL